jgi:glycosyltransferase involved in cell wall biosynthesis
MNAVSSSGEVESAPWVSFCIATYNRPERLRNVIESISSQAVPQYEVIVSDNDPGQSSRKTVEAFGDSRLRYFSNSVNVGMVRNFNIALGHARGRFVVMITDDDPIYPNMLSTLSALAHDCPGFGAYYGACDVVLETRDAADAYATEVGLKSFLAPVAQGDVRLYPPSEFLVAYFGRKIFPYMLWSTGIVRRDIALGIGGMPDYGSPFLTDFAYMALAGAEAGFATINVSLGYQAVHGQNSGFTHPHSLQIALDGSHGLLAGRFSKRADWIVVRRNMEAYLARYIIGHIVAMRRHFKRQRHTEQFQDYARLRNRLFEIPYVRKLRHRYYMAVILDAFPLLRHIRTWLKKLAAR